MRSKPLFWAVCLLAGLLLQAPAVSAGLQLGIHARWKRTLIVGPGATETESGANLAAAIDAVTAGAEQPWLIKIEPGVYDLGEGYLQTKPYVHLAGSGEAATVITARRQGGATLRGSDHVDIRELTVVNAFDGDEGCTGVETVGSPFRLRNVTVDVTAYCTDAVGVDSRGSEVDLNGVTVRVAGAANSKGIYHDKAPARMNNISVAVSCVQATGEAGPGPPPPADAWGIAIYDAGTTQSPVRLENVRVTASGDTFAAGIDLDNAAVEANRVDSRAESSFIFSYAWAIQNSQAVSISNATATASGAAYAKGFMLTDSALTLVNVDAAATDAAHETGIEAFAANQPRTIRLDHCRISGSEYGIDSKHPDYTFYVGASRIHGPVSATGTWHCAYCCDGDYTALTDTCQQP
jgi:hypothetical protein